MHPEIWKAATKAFGDVATFDIVEALDRQKGSAQHPITDLPLLQAFSKSDLSVELLTSHLNQELPGYAFDWSLVEAILLGEARDLEIEIILAHKLGIPLDSLRERDLPDAGGPSVNYADSVIPYVKRAQNVIGSQQLVNELCDYLEPDEAQELAAKLEHSPADFTAHLDVRFPQDGTFKPDMLRMVTALVTKDYRVTESLEKQIVEHAATDSELMDAFYLRGRARWYGGRIRSSVDDFVEAARRAENVNPVRQAQCYIYLADAKETNPGLPIERVDYKSKAIEIARTEGRPDLEILAQRTTLASLQSNRMYRESADLARHLLKQSESVLVGQYDHVIAMLRNDLGRALRNLQNETDRDEAELLYDQNIGNLDGSTVSGISRYLKSDLYYDRAQESLSQALTANDAAKCKELLSEAKTGKKTALNLCVESHRILQSLGEWPAARKAAQRLLSIQGHATIDLETLVDANDGGKTKADRVAAIVLGGKVNADSAEQPGQVALDSDERLEELLGHFIQSSNDVDGKLASEPIHATRFLDEATLLCIPVAVEGSMVVRAYRRNRTTKLPEEVVTLVLNGYSAATRQAFACLRAFSDDAFRVEGPELFRQLQGRTITPTPIVDIDRVSKEFNRVVLLPPLTAEDWQCPIEWLATHNERGRNSISLLDLATEGLVYASSTNPLDSVNALLNNTTATLLATNQSLGDSTVIDEISRLTQREFSLVDMQSDFHFTAKKRLTIVIGLDNEELVERLQAWDWTNAGNVVLVLCSLGASGARPRGSIVQDVGRSIRRSMTNQGVVVASRLPVLIDEAERFVNYLMEPKNNDKSAGAVVTSYLQYAKRFGGDGMLHPWFVLA